MSETLDHTPGPWRVGRRVEGQHSVEAPTNRKAHADDDGFRIVATTRPVGRYGRADGEYTAQVNAVLISASPDLLDALRRLIRCHDEGCDDQWDKLIDIGRAAVAKATGTSPVPP